MGALMSMLRSSHESDEIDSDLAINLEAATPTPPESEIHNYVTELLRPAPVFLDSLRSYTGCGDAIRRAISSPSRESEEAAWNALYPAVLKLKDYYEFALRLEQEAFPRVLHFLCVGDVAKNLESFQATAKRLGDLLHFVSLFDELKMVNPNIQNDFSYYRRSLSRMKMASPQIANVPVHDELANRMSLFYAHSNPMMKLIITSTVENKRLPPENVTDLLALLSGVCVNAIAKSRVTEPAMTEYCLRVMVASVILYDHVDKAGAFNKTSKINIRAIVKVIQASGGPSTQSLMNSLAYSTVHLKDETTPKAIRALFPAAT
ncbi:hypothetical protein BJ742DRAFT_811735 [Cladochytrium replicatum]|nr:hypothetical protein BJ742DRAFT_811735 [Cladochytrium replicatum]